MTNYITLTFIMKYDVLFLESGETSPHSSDFDLVSFRIYSQLYPSHCVGSGCIHRYFNLQFIVCF